MPRKYKSVKILSANVDSMTELMVVAELESALSDHRKLRLGVVNAAKLVKMDEDAQLREDVLSSDLVLADGMSVVWASRILGNALPERVAGIDLMYRLFEIADREGYGVYCLGASEEVSAVIESNLRRDYPNLTVSGRRNGYFDEPEEESVAKGIRDAAPDILLVAMTSPKKENFMGRWDEYMQIPIVHGVGGSFDVYSGKVERAPESWQRLGLEWLYRVKQEPGRLWKRYAKTNLAFIWRVILQKFGRLE